MDLIDSLAQSIATMEGYFKGDTIAQRNNNPGNLRSWGGTPTANGYAVFATAEEGWAALRQQITKNISRGLTLQEFFGGKSGVYGGYAPAADKNDPGGYARYVAGRAGIAVDQPLSSILQGGGAWPSFSAGPSWGDAGDVDAAGGNSVLFYGAIAAAVLAAAWLVLE